jgi:hypothetical protein
MSEADWTAMTDATHHALESADVSKGVTQAFTPPNGGGSTVLGFHALTTSGGFAGYLYSGDSSFAPITGNKGGVITAAIRKYNDVDKYSPMIGFISGTNLQSAKAYAVGLSNTVPYVIALHKGLVISGLDTTGSTILRQSDASYSDLSAWHHLRLEVLVNPHGEVVLNVFKNDLSLHTVSSPSWAAIDGMTSYVDDSLGIATGDAPLVSGFRPFVGLYTGDTAGSVGFIDHVTVARQQNP